jgi:hypothetical protein
LVELTNAGKQIACPQLPFFLLVYPLMSIAGLHCWMPPRDVV